MIGSHKNSLFNDKSKIQQVIAPDLRRMSAMVVQKALTLAGLGVVNVTAPLKKIEREILQLLAVALL